ncbi:Guanine deaminase [Cedecea neteri]|uniref:Guanine deaminase n=1 Tax=Cedecea neteri TaxID=158822 RepID=A0A291E5Z9_9ENTR|nr:guanine deaminase [Cedecea neteri]ATF95363.1 guanine deaminase [Cedecea neteri]SQC91984.1 Guanine deaminase [Cedecea neteri]
MKHAFFASLLLAPFITHASLTGYKGDILHFTGDPQEKIQSRHYIHNGLLLVKDGYIVDVGSSTAMQAKYHPDQIIDYSGKIISPGFVDTHVHFPQIEMTASYGKQLLDWLDDYVFPTEIKFSAPEHATIYAGKFIDELINNGTTTALVFATSNPVSVDALFSKALGKNMRLISGKVLMDRNAPAPLLDTPETAYQQSKMLIEKWKNKGRLGYAVTPRFAPTSSEAELRVAGRLLREYPDVWLQTHLAENWQEVSWVKTLFPWSKSYLDVYRHYGLVTPKSVFAHSVHVSDADFQILATLHSSVAFCPLSNLFLGSGLFNLEQSQKNQVKTGLGTDVGGGTSLSMLKVMGGAYNVTQLRKAFTETPENIHPLDPMENWYMATLGGARALSLDHVIGSFTPGKEADFIVINPQSDNALKIRTENSKSVESKIFAIEMMGDDRTIEHTYIMGEKVK